MTATAIALGISAVLCAALTTHVVMHVPGSIVVVERLEPAPGVEACSGAHLRALLASQVRLDEIQVNLRQHAHDPTLRPQLQCQLDAVGRYQDQIHSLFRACHDRHLDEEPEVEPPPVPGGCG